MMMMHRLGMLGCVYVISECLRMVSCCCVPGQGKVASAYTTTGGPGCGYGGHEAILASMHATFLQHGMVCVHPIVQTPKQPLDFAPVTFNFPPQVFSCVLSQNF
jgi:hypothetical protein